MAKLKHCKNCRNKFIPVRFAQNVCSIGCSIEWARRLKSKREASETKKQRKERKAGLEKLKTKRDYEREIDKLFQEWIRWRDKEEACICCGTPASPDGNESDAGHYISRRNKALRWFQDNCHKQRKYCNQYLGGNYAAYRIGLIERIGLARVEFLERRDHVPPEYTIDELIQIKAALAREIRKLKK